jgi:hypothetical protein
MTYSSRRRKVQRLVKCYWNAISYRLVCKPKELVHLSCPCSCRCKLLAFLRRNHGGLSFQLWLSRRFCSCSCLDPALLTHRRQEFSLRRLRGQTLLYMKVHLVLCGVVGDIANWAGHITGLQGRPTCWYFLLLINERREFCISTFVLGCRCI